MKTMIALTFASALVLVTAGCAQKSLCLSAPRAVCAISSNASRNPHFLTVNMYNEDRHEFRRGYHDGFERGKFDRKHGVARPY